MADTAFTRLIGCRHPLQQAGMGGSATPELAGAVSAAGALGMLGGAGRGSDRLSSALDRIEQITTEPVGINFLMPFVDRAAVELAAARVRLVEFFYGDPDPSLVGLARAGGALVAWQVGSAEEARRAADAGVDLVIAQGVEAGGHVRGEVELARLLPEVLGCVAVPVLAAGGLGTAGAVAAVIDSGAAGARLGTRFLAADEADVHPDYLAALTVAEAEDTVLTTTFSLFWPDAPHRVLRSCVAAALGLTDAVAAHDADSGQPVPALSPPSPGRSTVGRVDAMALYAGYSVSHVHGPQTAAEIVAELVSELD